MRSAGDLHLTVLLACQACGSYLETDVPVALTANPPHLPTVDTDCTVVMAWGAAHRLPVLEVR